MFAVRATRSGRRLARFATRGEAERYARWLKRTGGAQRVARSPGRVWIEKGKLIQTVNAAAGVGGFLDDFDVPYTIEFQLFENTGEPATGSYKGVGTISKHSGKTFVVLGDAYKDATLNEYTAALTATEESLRKLDDFSAGIAQAIAGKRVPKTASYEYREGFAEGRKLKGKH